MENNIIKNIETNNFSLSYIHKTYKYQKIFKNILIIELLRTSLYNKLCKKLLELVKGEMEPSLSLDILSLLIFNHKFKSDVDPIFDNDNPFKKKKIKSLFNKKCITYCNKKQINTILKVYPLLFEDYKLHYAHLTITQHPSHKHLIDEVIYNFYYELINNKIKLKLDIINNIFELKYKKYIMIPEYIFNRFVSLYNIKMLNNYKDKTIIDEKVLEYIYILFNRYYLFQNGNNQASILPSFKKILKDNLNIKIELFGSPINTSNVIFGSFFYDIEYIFGSVGNFFDTKIIKGYYEINPVFDKCIISKMFNKTTKELINADNNKLPLLFFYIIPISYFKYFELPENLKQYVSYNIILEKKDFPYMVYNRTYTRTKVIPIVKTNIIICNTQYINNYVKNNLLNFNEILDKWIKKKEL